jgi:DnaJ-class molecular chaperone
MLWLSIYVSGILVLISFLVSAEYQRTYRMVGYYRCMAKVIIIDTEKYRPSCSVCKGKKRVDLNAPNGVEIGHNWTTCSQCGGTGYQN